MTEIPDTLSILPSWFPLKYFLRRSTSYTTLHRASSRKFVSQLQFWCVSDWQDQSKGEVFVVEGIKEASEKVACMRRLFVQSDAAIHDI